jgi:predicted negative regulator of RcsB-dependent stress response
VALRQAGSAAEADYLLAAAALTAENCRRNAPRSAESAARLAYVRAAQGQKEEALRQLETAVSRGWLPDGRFQALDFAREPAFAALRGDPRLRELRRRVLGHIASERAELGPLRI